MSVEKFAADLSDALEVASRGGVTELYTTINGVEVLIIVQPKTMKEEN
jgi:hypothetical protein